MDRVRSSRAPSSRRPARSSSPRPGAPRPRSRPAARGVPRGSRPGGADPAARRTAARRTAARRTAARHTVSRQAAARRTAARRKAAPRPRAVARQAAARPAAARRRATRHEAAPRAVARRTAARRAAARRTAARQTGNGERCLHGPAGGRERGPPARSGRLRARALPPSAPGPLRRGRSTGVRPSPGSGSAASLPAGLFSRIHFLPGARAVLRAREASGSPSRPRPVCHLRAWSIKRARSMPRLPLPRGGPRSPDRSKDPRGPEP